IFPISALPLLGLQPARDLLVAGRSRPPQAETACGWDITESGINHLAADAQVVGVVEDVLGDLGPDELAEHLHHGVCRAGAGRRRTVGVREGPAPGGAVRRGATSVPATRRARAARNGQASAQTSSSVAPSSTSRAAGPHIPITASSVLASRSATGPSSGSMLALSHPRSESTTPAPVTTRKRSSPSRVTVTSATIPPPRFRSWV